MNNIFGIALQKGNATVVLDDLLARKCAKLLEVPLIGSIGLLVKARRTGLIDFIQAIKKEPAQPPRKRQASYLRAREILKKCSGSLADDIVADRDDRV